MKNIMEMSIQQYHSALESGDLTTEMLVQTYLERIAAYDQQGPQLNAIICVNDHVLDEARELDRRYKEGGLTGRLHGVPILLKDNVQTALLPTTAGSKSLEGYVPEEDAFIVKRMKEAGALIIAKTNLHEFAIWGETISSIQGQTLNPYDLTRTPGGSSGGTGAAVAANFGMVGIGTDTVNSVRSPSSANCLVGIRPTVGLVSKAGIVPYSYTQDAAGPMARSVEDAAILLDSIKGFDPDDMKTAWIPDEGNESYADNLIVEGLHGKRIGVLSSFFGSEKIHEDVNRVIRDAIAIMKENGAEIIDLNDSIDQGDLVRNVSVHLHDLKDHLNDYLKTLPDSVQVHSLGEILTSGKYHQGIEENLKTANTLSTGTDEYNRRLIRRAKVQDQLMQILAANCLDAIVYPHQQQLVCKIGGSQAQRNGVLASVTGFPSISIPAGFSMPEKSAPLGVPIGMELLGRPFSEERLIEIAYGFEQKTRVRIPPLSVPDLSKGEHGE